MSTYETVLIVKTKSGKTGIHMKSSLTGSASYIGKYGAACGSYEDILKAVKRTLLYKKFWKVEYDPGNLITSE